MAADVIPDGLAAMLRCEDATWREVWGRISLADTKNAAVELVFNVTEYAFDPGTRTVLVGGLTVDDGEVRVHIDDFARVVGPYLRGAPK